MHYAPLGDHAVLITFGDGVSEAMNRLVRDASARIAAAGIAGVTDIVPAFASVAVHYQPSPDRMQSEIVTTLRAVLASQTAPELPAPRLVQIPVCYGGDLGPDLEDLASAHDLSPSDVISLHSGTEYLVYMVGFMPGFAYLGGLPPEIATPRRSSPRTHVPAGAVGIGGQQTGVYPLESPGGWNLIGRTPIAMFDIHRDEPTLLASGDRVRFCSISRRDYDNWNRST
jgi:inhibitor of KinA